MKVGPILCALGIAWSLSAAGCGDDAVALDGGLDSEPPADASMDGPGGDASSSSDTGADVTGDGGGEGGLDAGSADAAPCTPESPVCDYPSCGCDPGEGCYPAGGRMCLPAGTLPKDAPCRGLADCVPGFICRNGSCRAICESDEDCVGVERCQLVVALPRVCTDDCILGSTIGCVDGYTCGLNYSGGEPFVLCSRDDDSLPGDYTPCSTLEGGICAIGLTCTRPDAGGEQQCRRYCPLPDDGSCPDGGTCVEGRIPVTIGDQPYGVCTL